MPGVVPGVLSLKCLCQFPVVNLTTNHVLG